MAENLDRTEDAQEQATNTKNTKPAGSTWTVHGLPADCSPGAYGASRAQNREVKHPYPSMDLPNGLSSWRKIWGRSEESLGDAMPQNMGPQMN
jgi:hypothetical protein